MMARLMAESAATPQRERHSPLPVWLFTALLATAPFTATPVRADSTTPPKLGLPIVCPDGAKCMIQQYVDIDPGPGVRDFTCGTATYNGHKGTDFRVLRLTDVERGVDVVAVAPGRVVATRNSMPDRLVRSPEARKAVRNRECGNGLRIDHGGGWETQYCHLRQDSVIVTKGERVERGQKLGLVGYSGLAAFAHVHVGLKKNRKVIDPFTGRGIVNDCSTDRATSFWDPSIADSLTYRAGEIVDLGFSPGPTKRTQIERGRLDGFAPKRDSKALVGWGWAINLRKDDRMRIRLTGPGGAKVAENSVSMDRNKAEYFVFSGKRRPKGGWPSGDYRVTVTVTRDGATVGEASRDVSVR